MIRRPLRRFRPSPAGGFELRLPANERALLRTLPNELTEALASMKASQAEMNPTLRRLFPPAYRNDDEAEDSYVRLVRQDLLEEHRAALDLLTRTVESTHLESDELDGWLGAINDLRLVLGTSLNVSEDQVEIEPSDPRYAQWVCYGYLSFLQGQIIESLAGLLPTVDDSVDDALPDDPWGEPLGGLRWDGTPTPESP